MNKSIVKNILFPAHEFLLARKTLKKYKEYSRIDELSSKDLSEYRFNKLKKLLCFSFESIPYYKELFLKNGLKPLAINSFEDFKKVPFLTREIVRKQTKNMVSKE